MKTKNLFLSLLLIAGCTSQNVYVPEGDSAPLMACPKVEIKAEDRAIIQKAGGQDLFKIELTGYAGNCYYDERISKDKAVVSPRFKITRLTNNHVEDVHFSYYLETAEGPTRFLGKKTYFAEVNMVTGVNEIVYTAPAGELSAPIGKQKVDMYVGLNAIAEDSEYKVK